MSITTTNSTNSADVLADQLADWADGLAETMPYGSEAAASRVRHALALRIREAVEDAREELQAINSMSHRAVSRARELSQLGLLPEGVTFDEHRGLYVDGHPIHIIVADDLGEQAGKDVDSQRARRRAAQR